jgi:ATP-dependent RNA helicase HelY
VVNDRFNRPLRSDNKKVFSKKNFHRDDLAEMRRDLFDGMGIPQKQTFIPDDFQNEAISLLAKGFDTLVVAPTGSGKTFIAFEAINDAVKKGKRAVYTTPLKALSNSKYNELKKRFEGVCEVGLLTGDRKIDSKSQVVVATTEIYRNELYQGSDGDAIVILDEVHFIADPQRGPVWEESIILAPKSSTLLMLSASISNHEEIAEWIAEVRGTSCKIVVKTGRSVELRYAFLDPEIGVIPMRDEKGLISHSVNSYYAGMNLDPAGMRLKEGKNKKSDRLQKFKSPDKRR